MPVNHERMRVMGLWMHVRMRMGLCPVPVLM